MAKAKPKIIVLEGLSVLSNKELEVAISSFVQRIFEQDEFVLTQKPKVQAVQVPKAAR
jgi:pantothenate kinase